MSRTLPPDVAVERIGQMLQQLDRITGQLADLRLYNAMDAARRLHRDLEHHRDMLAAEHRRRQR